MAMTPTGTRVKPAPRPQPQRSAEFAHLTLEALRAHRRSLSDEEARVSYWRRLVQARLDLLREAARSGSADGRVESLRATLTEVRPLGGRTSHQACCPRTPRPRCRTSTGCGPASRSRPTRPTRPTSARTSPSPSCSCPRTATPCTAALSWPRAS